MGFQRPSLRSSIANGSAAHGTTSTKTSALLVWKWSIRRRPWPKRCASDWKLRGPADRGGSWRVCMHRPGATPGRWTSSGSHHESSKWASSFPKRFSNSRSRHHVSHPRRHPFGQRVPRPRCARLLIGLADHTARQLVDDVSHHLAAVLDVETRRAHEADLLRGCRRELESNGAAAPTWEEHGITTR
jgi:hypothetical protein